MRRQPPTRSRIENAKVAMKSTAPGYMSTGEIHGATTWLAL
jgi:hypothetical protein